MCIGKATILGKYLRMVDLTVVWLHVCKYDLFLKFYTIILALELTKFINCKKKRSRTSSVLKPKYPAVFAFKIFFQIFKIFFYTNYVYNHIVQSERAKKLEFLNFCLVFARHMSFPLFEIQSSNFFLYRFGTLGGLNS